MSVRIYYTEFSIVSRDSRSKGILLNNDESLLLKYFYNVKEMVHIVD